MRRLSRLKGVVDTWRELENKVADLSNLVDLSLAEEDRSLEQDISSEIDSLSHSLEEIEFQLQLWNIYTRKLGLERHQYYIFGIHPYQHLNPYYCEMLYILQILLPLFP